MSQADQKHHPERLPKHPIVDFKKCRALCDCGLEHTIPSIQILESEDAFDELARDCAREYGKGPVFLLDDESTHKAAGAKVSLSLDKFSVDHKVLTLPDGPVTTDELAEEVKSESMGHELIIAVGAGTINDLGRYVADGRGIPYWLVPTAISMNGYTSSIVAIKIHGVKRTLPAKPPQYIYVDPRVIQRCPLKLRQAGFCDVLAKSVSDYDWQTESLLFHGTYCSLPSAIVHEPEKKYIDCPEKIRDDDLEAMLGLFEGLLYSGVAMSLAGSSAPASGGEHLVSHFLDMREHITGIKPNLHGLQVGAGLILSAACYRRLAAHDGTGLEGAAEAAYSADANRIESIWGELAPEVANQFGKKKNRLLKFNTMLPEHWPGLRELYSNVRPPGYFLDLIRRTGFAMTFSALEIPEEEFFLAATSARTIRDRITVLDLAAHAGILEEAAREVVELLS